MFFYRASRIAPRVVTPQRLAAARASVRREKESVALFPELARYDSAEERIADQNRQRDERAAMLRDQRAADWRRARAALRARADAETLREHWQGRIYPGTPEYLLDLIRRVESGVFDVLEYRRDLERVSETGRKWRESIG